MNSKTNNKIIVLIIALVGVLSILVAIFILLFDNNKDTNDLKENTIIRSGVVSYGKYDFTIPEYCIATINKNAGVIFSDGLLVFSVVIDKENTIEDYKKYFTKKYPKMTKNKIAVIDKDRRYLLINGTDKEKHKMSMYVSKTGNKDSVFVGYIVHSDFIDTSREDLPELTEILDSSKYNAKEKDVVANALNDEYVDFFNKSIKTSIDNSKNKK